MEFIAGDQAELLLLEAFLVEHFPGASVANRPAGWTGEFRASATFNINKTLKNFSELDLVNRTEITLLLQRRERSIDSGCLRRHSTKGVYSGPMTRQVPQQNGSDK
jgi:hypothetical protein